MALRFANTFFENQWDNKNIDNVQITVSETDGVKDRISYYNQYGAIRDMLQNHLLQLICLVAMEPPSFYEADQMRDEKLRVLKALKPLTKDEIQTGQYRSFTDELGNSSNTETFVALKVMINNWRWAGVPFYIRTGKKLSTKASEIIITFKKKPHDIFSKFTKDAQDNPNRLIIRVQPEEGLKLKLTSKAPGPGGMRFFPSELNLSFGDTFSDRLPDAYERLLMDVVRGNQTLFMRSDEVLAAWDYIDPIVSISKEQEPQLYRTGTMGPEDKILSIDGHKWIDPKD
jgi:glucose-6-phosphate 1-dehydrogenase